MVRDVVVELESFDPISGFGELEPRSWRFAKISLEILGGRFRQAASWLRVPTFRGPPFGINCARLLLLFLRRVWHLQIPPEISPMDVSRDLKEADDSADRSKQQQKSWVNPGFFL